MNEHRRLDPETILKQLQKTDQKKEGLTGILKIYLGYSAGVGKTYRMLQNAHQMKKQGIDIVIGLVETHGRSETEALLENLEIIPRKSLEYQGIRLEEMDIDAILKRKPAIVLVDELAHTNVPGSRHAKRYQDVEELINAGIHVVTAVNVQHFESINDIVEQMTDVKVKETVPDSVINSADEIELVDIPIDELERRLQEGKVYIPEKARQAMMEFFKRSNLMGLRELSLRYTARQVGEEILSYMRDNAIHNPIPVGSRIMIGISASPLSQKLIRIAHRMASDLDAEWFGVTVDSPQFGMLTSAGRQQLAMNMNLAENLGGKVVRLVGNRVADEMAKFARSNNMTLVLLGFPSRSAWDEFIRGSVVNDLIKKMKPIQIMLVDTGEITGESLEKGQDRTVNFQFWKYLVSMTTVGVTASVIMFFRSVIGFTNISMLMILPVLIMGIVFGFRQGLFSSLLSVALLDFLFVEPYYSFSVSDIRLLPVFLVFIIIGIVTSILSDRVRWRIDRYREQERFMSTIYQFSRELLKYQNLEEVLKGSTGVLTDFLDCDMAILLPNSKGEIKVSALSENARHFGENERGIANWVYKNEKTAGRSTDTLSSSPWYFVPMKSVHDVIGVLAIYRKEGLPFLTKEEQEYLDSFTNLIALSISRTLNLSSSIAYLMNML